MGLINGALSNFKLQGKLWLVVFVALVGMLLLTATSLLEKKEQMLLDRESKIRNVVELGYGVLVYFQQQEQLGKLTPAEARAAALTVIKGLRYDENEYLWINDMEPRVIMHPFSPHLDGQFVGDYKDPAGKPLFREFVKAVKAHGKGFVSYMWPKPGSSKSIEKISYVKGFAPWGWVVGSGIYLDDVDEAFNSSIRFHFLLVGFFSAMLLVASLCVVLNIKSSMSAFNLAISRIEEDNDLSVRVDIRGRDEFVQLAGVVNNLLENFHDVLKRVRASIEGLSASVMRMADITENMSQGVRKQQLETDQVATAVNEMVATVQEVARNAAATAEATQKADDDASKGQQVVTSAIRSIDNLSQVVQQATEVIRKLAEDSQQIGTVVDVINAIAEQTNLLALNAAIEAARAGDQGRGFAVVADEVRTLAKRTQDSTSEIQLMIEQLQTTARQAERAMEQGSIQAENSVGQAANAGKSLDAITKSVATILLMSDQIATAAEEQGAVAEEINRNIVNIAQVAEQTTEETKRTESAGEELARLTTALQSMVARYVV